MKSIVIVSAGLGEPSTTRLLADRFVSEAHRKIPDARVEIIELRSLAHPIIDAMLTQTSSPELAEAVRKVTNADGLVAITPTYNAAYSGLFKSFFDILEPGSIAGVPIVIAATGGSERHSLVPDHSLRPLFSHARAVTAPTSVYAARSDFESDTELNDRIGRATSELVLLMESVNRGKASAASLPVPPPSRPIPTITP